MTKDFIETHLITNTGRVSKRSAKTHNISVEKVYQIYHNISGGKCKNCGNNTEFISFTKGYKKVCNNKCAGELRAKTGVAAKATDKAKQTCIEKYGENYTYDRVSKIKNTKLERYGNENYNNKDQIAQTKFARYADLGYCNIEKSKQTKLERYGNEFFPNSEKAKQTKLERYGNENYNNSIKCKQTKLKKYGDSNYNNRNKSLYTCIEKYGFENVMQSGLFESGYKWKNYVLPSGKNIRIQGYENKLLDELLEIYDEDDIKTSRKDMPVFLYEDDNKVHRYFPDIFIPSENVIYEVKSKWTSKLNKEINFLKYQAVENSNYRFILKIYD